MWISCLAVSSSIGVWGRPGAWALGEDPETHERQAKGAASGHSLRHHGQVDAEGWEADAGASRASGAAAASPPGAFQANGLWPCESFHGW